MDRITELVAGETYGFLDDTAVEPEFNCIVTHVAEGVALAEPYSMSFDAGTGFGIDSYVGSRLIKIETE